MRKGEIALLKDSAIHELSNDMSYRKGCRYFKDGRVAKILRRPGTSIYVATVEGSEDYEVRVRLDKAGEKIEAYDCTCPAAALYDGACKHVVALLKLIQAGQLEEEGEGTVASVPYQKPVGRIFDCFARAKKHAHLNAPKKLLPAALREAPIFLEPHFFFERHYGRSNCWLEFRIGRERLYVMRSIQEFMRSFLAGTPIEFGKKLTVDPQTAAFAPGIATMLWHFLLDLWKDEVSSLYYGGAYGARLSGTIFEGKAVKLTPSALVRFLSLMQEADAPFQARTGVHEERTVEIVEGTPALELGLAERAGSGRLMMLTD